MGVNMWLCDNKLRLYNTANQRVNNYIKSVRFGNRYELNMQ